MTEITRKDLIKAVEALEAKAKSKKPSKRFPIINDAMVIIEKITDKSDCIKIEYGIYDASIYIKTSYLNMNLKKMPYWRELMSMVDMIEIVSLDDGNFEMELNFNNIFE